MLSSNSSARAYRRRGLIRTPLSCNVSLSALSHSLCLCDRLTASLSHLLASSRRVKESNPADQQRRKHRRRLRKVMAPGEMQSSLAADETTSGRIRVERGDVVEEVLLQGNSERCMCGVGRRDAEQPVDTPCGHLWCGKCLQKVSRHVRRCKPSPAPPLTVRNDPAVRSQLGASAARDDKLFPRLLGNFVSRGGDQNLRGRDHTLVS